MDKELQNLLDNYEQTIYGYAEPIIPSTHQIHLLLDYISKLGIQAKKQKEVIDKVEELLIIKKTRCLNEDDYVLNVPDLDDILHLIKEVSE